MLHIKLHWIFCTYINGYYKIRGKIFLRKTKIICTLGTATDDEKVLRELMINGMDVCRINMSHQTQEDQKRRIDKVKKLREELGLPVALLLDTKGPEIRTGTFEKPKVTLKKGNDFTLTTRNIVGDENIVSISYKDLPKDIKKGCKILIDDGLIELRAEYVDQTDIRCKVINGGVISSNKGINIPDINLSLPFLNKKDKDDIAFAVREDFDFIAASFTRNSQDIMQLKAELKRNNDNKIKIISKIENADGVNNIDEIIKVSDGIMIARGDLGVEIPLEDIPIIQKELISKANDAGKHVITATQMLDSMIKNPRPTRAESTDVANAIYDGTSAIMLSGETAAGSYPVEALKTMSKIAVRAESDINYVKRLAKKDITGMINITSAISHATCTTAHDLGAASIIAVSKSGRTVEMISKYRPNCPIIAGTTDVKVLRQMNLSWAVVPIMIEEKSNTDEIFEHVVDVALENHLVKDGDLVVISAGVPLGVSGTTNLLKVQLVGNVLITGKSVNDGTVYGNLCVCNNEQEARMNFKPGDILVIPYTSNEILDIMRKSSGIITEEEKEDSHALIVGLTLDKPTIIGAESATKILTSGTAVTLDASNGVVFNGKKKEKQ